MQQSSSIQEQHIIAIRERERQRWQKETGYNRRSKVENAMYRSKLLPVEKCLPELLSFRKPNPKLPCLFLTR